MWDYLFDPNPNNKMLSVRKIVCKRTKKKSDRRVGARLGKGNGEKKKSLIGRNN